ncbi:MAG: hypothetical protein Q7T48_03700 [Cellvibrio sp.]|uniref:hypothetical protein n=1 Tax=Cellvibrio sp. TaxID=1965322 RepID=UPI002718907B|nr:hypothetical protein [Cellvibrio sp.]
MSYRLLKILTFSSACITLLACTSTAPSLVSIPKPISITTPTKISEWEAQLPEEQGAIKITFTLPEQARAEFQLFDGKPRHISFAMTRITFSNENCISGHLTAINYKKNDSEYHIKYFEKEAPWNNTNTVTMAWGVDNKITTTLNDETISVDIARDVSTLKIVSYLAPIDIQRIEYLPR